MSKQHIRGGLLFDGTGAPGVARDLVIEGGRVRAVLEPGTKVEGAEVVDASGAWVCPGFLDLHTHYDAEVEVLPGLSESVRHGVTSVVFGSCGLSMAVGDPVDLADMFCRVEGIPRETVLPILEARKRWDSPAAYLAHLRRLPLGPNVACLLGHSTIRAHVMGIERSLTPGVRPTSKETRAMQSLLEESLDAGMLGLSVNTLTWDKMDGDETRPYRSRPTPSTYATWGEYRSLTRILRRRGRIFQGVPNVSTKWNVLMFFLESLGVVRPGLKTMLISMMDAKAARMPFRLVGALSRIVNTFMGADMRFQSLPNVFDLWIDGLEAPVFEEVGAGTEALTLKGHARATLLRDPAFRRRFKRQWANVLFGRAFHRDLADTEILECPDDPSLVGKSFGDVARERKVGHVDAFLDVVAEHGDALRWYTVVGNDRPRWLRWIAAHPAVLVGFSDAGAHLRNMAHYNFPLRLLKMVRDAEKAGRPFMSTERAVHRVTGELADYLGLDAGHLAEGERADLVVVDPEGLTDDVERIVEREMEGFDGLRRLVRRNDDAVRAVFVGGRKVVENGRPLPSLGQTRSGRVLTATS